jgi:hypothetical protein
MAFANEAELVVNPRGGYLLASDCGQCQQIDARKSVRKGCSVSPAETGIEPGRRADFSADLTHIMKLSVYA